MSSSAAANRSKLDRLLTAEDPVDVMDRGVSFDFLSKLLKKQKLGGKLTTRNVVEQYVIPQTSNSICSLSGLLRVLHPHQVGRATHYVIHAWDGSFERLVHALAAVDASLHEEGDTTPFYWIDIFALNQREQMSRHLLNDELRWIQRDNLFSELKSILRQIHQVCVISDPLDKPLVLERKWCLFECAQVLSMKRQEFMVCCVPEPPDVDPFATLLDSPKFEQNFTVDFAAAKCTAKLDEEWLGAEALTLSPLGLAYINTEVNLQFLAWISNRLAARVLVPGFLDFMHQREQMEDRLRVMHQLSKVLAHAGEVNEAREILNKAMLRAEKLWGDEAVHTLEMQHDFACLLARGFKELKPAEVMLRTVLEMRIKMLGHEHEHVIVTSEALGLVLKERRKLTEAITQFRSVVAWKQRTLGRTHAETLKSMNHLGLALQKKELYEEAELVLKHVVMHGTEVLGPQNLDLMIWSNNLSMLYQDTKQLDKAELLLKLTLRNSESALGPMHTHTLTLVYNLGFVMWQQGRFRFAEQLFRRELAACEATKGMDHRDTDKSRRNLERFLVAWDADTTSTNKPPVGMVNAIAAQEDARRAREPSLNTSIEQSSPVNSPNRRRSSCQQQDGDEYTEASTHIGTAGATQGTLSPSTRHMLSSSEDDDEEEDDEVDEYLDDDEDEYSSDEEEEFELDG